MNLFNRKKPAAAADDLGAIAQEGDALETGSQPDPELVPGAPGMGPQPDQPAPWQLLLLPLKITCNLVCPGWQITDEEQIALAQAWDPVLEKYLPGFMLGPEATAILVTAGVVLPRLTRGQALKPEPDPAAGHSSQPGEVTE